MNKLLAACGDASIMLMGMSFILGSLATIFLLVLLELMRSRHQGGSEAE